MNKIFNFKQIHRMIDDIPNDFYPLIQSEEQALKYLYLLDRTFLNNISNLDMIDYELLIYLELFFKHNQEIQQLINNIKKTIYHNYIIKYKYIKRLTDDLCENNIEYLHLDAPVFDPLMLGVNKN